MNFFSRQESVGRARVYKLFLKLGDISEEYITNPKTRKVEYAHSMEIMNAAGIKTGKSSLSADNFNLSAYEFKCGMTDNRIKMKSAEKESALVFNDTDKLYEEKKYGVVDGSKFGNEDDGFEKAINEIDYEFAIKELLKLRDEFIIEKSVDVVEVLRQAIKDIKIAKDKLVTLCKESDTLQEIIISLLSSKERTINETLCILLE